ncbi:ribonucleoside-diphosphate reductase subunit alpha [Pseudomonas putida]|uniref:Ribonucleoside-diphosphate reductase n=1 Tax=Pseudomonas putida TaxID=303 RepID=A0A8I1ECT6_PSEPU|nr:ribonucleoside-diphosphate reductase subunit alpha [Pseudomonas putida]
MITVIKRDGTTDALTQEKIERALLKAFIEVEGDEARGSQRVSTLIQTVTEKVMAACRNLDSVGIEAIQDAVEKNLMLTGEHKVCKAYILYREERAKLRAKAEEGMPKINYKNEIGELHPVTLSLLVKYLKGPCQSLKNVKAENIAREAMKNLYEGVAWKDVLTALRMASRGMIEAEPEYTYVTARLLLKDLKQESRELLGVGPRASYAEDLAKAISFGVKIKQLNPKMASDLFDIKVLGAAIDESKDLQFNFLGAQTLYDRYFLHQDDVRYERPQVFFMRIAMGLALREDNPTKRAIEFYNLLSSFDYMASTPTLFNAGCVRAQLSSCYLTTVPDDLSGIYHAIHDNAMLSKFAGGLGNDWTPVRSLGAYIKGTNGKSQGVVPFLKVVNDTAVAVNQGGKRKGAVCAYLETWHMDIEEFIELRKNTGDDRRRTHDMNTANWIPDLFMKRVFASGSWTLFSPSDVPDLHDLVGKAFEERYTQYEAMTGEGGAIKHFKVIPAADLWRKMLSMLFETGHPWLTFKDPCNLRSPQQHAGVVHSSNLCTEITLNTNKDEIAVCNLGSINLPNHIVDGKLDTAKLKRTVDVAVRMLDNVVDINYYAVPQAENSNLKHRPVGLGIMGYQDALYKLGLAYASEEAVQFADVSMEHLSYYAILASHELSIERGSYESFQGSLWSKGVLPIDSIDILREERGATFLDMDQSTTLDWAPVRAKAKLGMRNSNIMAIAPTATIANITGVSQSIEPTYQNLYVKSNLSGEFTVINAYLVADLKKEGLWDSAMINDLKFFDGSVQKIDRIPQYLKDRYATAFETEVRWLIDAASRRQKWIDQAQSLNLYIAGVSGRKLDNTYRMAWFKGLKTTYYLRALAATNTEKSTVTTGTHNAVSAN